MGGPAAATTEEEAKARKEQRKRCLRCGVLYQDEDNSPAACAFHGHITGRYRIRLSVPLTAALHYSTLVAKYLHVAVGLATLCVLCATNVLAQFRQLWAVNPLGPCIRLPRPMQNYRPEELPKARLRVGICVFVLQVRRGCFRCRHRTRGSTVSGATRVGSSSTGGTTVATAPIPAVPTGRGGGAAARSGTRKRRRAAVGTTSPTTMASLSSSHRSPPDTGCIMNIKVVVFCNTILVYEMQQCPFIKEEYNRVKNKKRKNYVQTSWSKELG